MKAKFIGKSYGTGFDKILFNVRNRCMNKSIRKLSFLDKFYKYYCCGAKNHPSGWKKDKHIASKAIRNKLKNDLKTEKEVEE